ncbi:hypothetical protein M404DRAFT_723985 [Pisolithus tinctorius Marx 270]|uniref:Uncharacterized protein n=1 Tax=Pisolithus tinctorius Marx 270 TaxID=870435 RepID=A0A0C3JWB7_PISTI|nr:hypothetical protein M404DRAFT_501228 [Pisolithus tinctorius Marx 270]KIO01732.1 hypothetical protein M404DRAFT_723985 [Pisolithus tinctorius Marx 270]
MARRPDWTGRRRYPSGKAHRREWVDNVTHSDARVHRHCPLSFWMIVSFPLATPMDIRMLIYTVHHAPSFLTITHTFFPSDLCVYAHLHIPTHSCAQHSV